MLLPDANDYRVPLRPVQFYVYSELPSAHRWRSYFRYPLRPEGACVVYLDKGPICGKGKAMML